MDIYWFDRVISPSSDFEEKIKKEKLNKIIKNHFKKEKEITVHWINYSEKNPTIKEKNNIIFFVELFIRTQIKRPCILVFNNVFSLCDDIQKGIRTVYEFRYYFPYPEEKIENVFFADISLDPLSSYQSELYEYLGMEDAFHTGPRKKVKLMMPATLEVVEALFRATSEERLLGQDYERVYNYMDKSKFVSIDRIADFINISSRTINHIIKPDKRSIRGILDLSREQKQLLNDAMLKDYKRHRSRIELKETIEQIK